jgi:hypothetical protein
MANINDLFGVKNYRPGYKYHWVYFDNGLPVMTVARYDEGKDKAYHQFHLQDNKWVEGMPPSPYPLFGLHSLKNPPVLDSLIITEGEKCATILHQLEWSAVSPVLGALFETE